MTTLQFLQTFFKDGDIIQLMFRSKFAVAGLFNDLAVAAKYIEVMAKQGGNIQVTRCPIDPTAKTVTRWGVNNKMRTEKAETKPCADFRSCSTSNNVMIDIDCSKPKEFADFSATEAELSTGSLVADQVVSYLTEQGFPAPLVLRTGSGFHILYKMESYNPVTEAYERLLMLLREKFTSAAAHVDISTYSPVTQLRVPGTWSRKGQTTADRPDRQIIVVSAPEVLTPVSRELIQKVMGGYAPTVSGTPTQTKFGNTRITQLRFEEILDELQYDWDRVTEGDSDHYYLSACPVKGERHAKQTRKTMFSWTQVGDRASIGFKCFAESCSEHTARDVFKLLDEESDTELYQEIFYSKTSLLELLAFAGVLDEDGNPFVYNGEPTLDFADEDDLYIIDDAEEAMEFARTHVNEDFAKLAIRKIGQLHAEDNWGNDFDLGQVKKYVPYEVLSDVWFSTVAAHLKTITANKYKHTTLNEPTQRFALDIVRKEMAKFERRGSDMFDLVTTFLGPAVTDTLVSQYKLIYKPEIEVPECLPTKFLQSQVRKEIQLRTKLAPSPTTYLASVQSLWNSEDRIVLGKFLGKYKLASFVTPEPKYTPPAPYQPAAKTDAKGKKTKLPTSYKVNGVDKPIAPAVVTDIDIPF